MSIHPVNSSSTRHAVLLVVLQIACAAAIACIPSVFLKSPVWNQPTLIQAELASFAFCYLVGAGLLIWREHSSRTTGIGTLVGLLAVVYAPIVLFFTLAQLDVPHVVLLAELISGALLVCVTAALRGSPRLRVAILIAAAVAGLSVQLPFIAKGGAPHGVTPIVQTWHANSSLYPLKITEYQSWIPTPKVAGGGMSPLGDGYLLATGDGDLYVVAETGVERGLNVRHLQYRVPINADEFTAAVGAKVDPTGFRVADVLVQPLAGKTRVFATHHFWKAAQKCFVVRISMLESSDSAALLASQPSLSWQTVFESSPCVPVEFPGRPPMFGGIQVGGRMALLNDHELLVTLGDNQLDGFSSPLSVPQDPAASYGKTVLLNLENFSSQVYSLGHRNPQGLFADSSGAIWSTEHGPQGGDELNLIQRGANYGWPRETYGVQYGTHAWPFDAVPGSHDDFTEPYYSWIPSIGVSNLLVPHGPMFKLWGGDLLVSSLKDRAIYRARVRESRVVMMERIPIGERIRDINEAPTGELLLWTDSGALVVVRIDVDVGTGERVFAACTGCHVIDNGDEHGFGPDLYHIVNRKVGTAVGFRYSPAMRELGGRWTTGRLDAFLTNPQGFLPGTKMAFPGISDPVSRAKLIEYLSSSNNRSPVSHPAH